MRSTEKRSSKRRQISARSSSRKRDRSHRIIDAVDDKPGEPVIYDLRYGAASKCDYRCAIGHRFDHDESERLGPIDRKQAGHRMTKEGSLVGLVDFLDERNQRIVEQRFNSPFVISPIDLVDLCRDS